MIPVNTPRLDGNESRYLQECIDSGWISSEGPFVDRFETAMAELTGRRHGIAVSNGTAALEVAVSALGLGPGDEVIMPSFTIISCASAVLRAGATTVFVDCRTDSWNLDVSQLEDAINENTRAIMAPHIYGLPVAMDTVLMLAERHGLLVIEDAAEAHGLSYRGRPCGSFGAISTFSFYPNKLVAAGEGGMLLTDDDVLAERCRYFRNLCFGPGRRFVHEDLGGNYRLSNLQAAVGLAQLEQLEDFRDRKFRMGAYYTEQFQTLEGVQLPLASIDGAENIYWVYGMVLEPEHPLEPEAAMAALREEGIGTRPFFWPLHEQPIIERLGHGGQGPLPVAERLARRGFYIPSGLGLSESDLAQVSDAVRRVLG